MGNCTYRVFLGILCILGLAPISNPFSQLSQLKFKACSISTAWSVLCLVYPVVLYTDAIHVIVRISQSVSYTLTQRFVIFTFVPVFPLCSTIARLVATFYCRKTIHLILALKNVRSQSGIFGQNIQQRKSRANWPNGVFLFACILRILTQLSTLLRALAAPSQNANLPLLTLPNELWIRLVAISYVSLSTYTALPFALGLVVIVGVALLDAQDDLYQLLHENCCSQRDNSASSSVFVKVRIEHEVRGNRVHPGVHGVSEAGQAANKEICKQFVVVKNLFRDYEVIAGWYALAVILFGSSMTIQSLSSTALKWESFTDGLTVLVYGATDILLVTFFGEHMRSMVRQLK